MRRGVTGDLAAGASIGGEVVRAFVPHPLPPEPALEISEGLREEMDQALLSLGRLDSISSLLPDTALFLYMYVRKEAVLSSQIEGTQSSLSDLLLFELDDAPGVPLDDVLEVSSYVKALELGVRRIREGVPLTGRLFREVHGVLLSGARGAEKSPGEYRRTQNWIGGSRPGNAQFVPPPPGEVLECMAELEKFIHDIPGRSPTLEKIALAHVQFETVHPFLDGNGRLGRLLITLMLVQAGVLEQPLLYLSLYLKEHRSTYYDLLTKVREEGDWEAWLEFFVDGVRQTAGQAVATARALSRVFAEDQEQVRALGRAAGSALRVHLTLQQHPVQTVRSACARTGLTAPTVGAAMRGLAKLGIVSELTGRQRDRVFSYRRYLELLNEGTVQG